MDCLQNISSAEIHAAIEGARQRVVFLAPGVSGETARLLSGAWQRLGAESLTVILDVDPEVIRLGYGTLEGLEEIQKTAASLGQAVGHQPGVRICVLMADETSLIFAPIPLLVEAGSVKADHHNGIRLRTTPTELGDELGAGEEGDAWRVIGLESADAGRLQTLRKELGENPAPAFEHARAERLFNARLEFVEFELEGCFISRHTVTIPAELVSMSAMDPQTREKLRSSFRLIEASDLIDSKTKVSEHTLREERQRIAKTYLRAITGFGTLIRRSQRAAFEREVAGLREKVAAFREALRAELDGIFKANATRLTSALLPSIAENPPEQWTGALGMVPTGKEIEQYLYSALLQSFGDPEALLREMRVNLNFKGVTHGTLSDERFIAETIEKFPNLKIQDEERIPQRDFFGQD